nr:UBN2 domain-containing protein [Tanacetum cinerariifolium]
MCWGKESANESGSMFINVSIVPSLSSSSHVFASPVSDRRNIISKFVCGFKNSDCGTESWSDNMVGSPHGFIIHWIVILKNIKKVTEVIDVKNWWVDNSWVSKWIDSLVKWNFSVSSTKSWIQKIKVKELQSAWGYNDPEDEVFLGIQKAMSKSVKSRVIREKWCRLFGSRDRIRIPLVARFNAIITSLKVLDEGFSSKNYVRKFFRALHPKWRAKVTAIEKSKDFSSLALDELIGNLKVHEVVMEKDSKLYRGKKKTVKSISLKAKKESSDDETSTSGSDEEEYAMAVRNFKKFLRRKGKIVRQPREETKSF